MRKSRKFRFLSLHKFCEAFLFVDKPRTNRVRIELRDFRDVNSIRPLSARARIQMSLRAGAT